MIAFVLTLLLLGKAALAAPCGDKIQGYNVDEDADDKLQPRLLISKLFEIEDYSRDSSFGFVHVKSPTAAKLEIGFLAKAKDAKVGRTLSFALAPSEHKPGGLDAVGFNPSKAFRGSEKAFVFRLLKADDTPLCEDQPRPIYGRH